MEILKADLTGTVAAYFCERGFGFVYCPSEHRRIFFHRSKFQRVIDPVIDEQVVFDLSPSKLADKPSVAVHVRPAEVSTGLVALLQDTSQNEVGR
jgi:cold shock CspA family protein